MNDGRCRRCGASLAGHNRNAIFCGDGCRRKWSNAGGGPVRESDTTIVAERKKLEGAVYACLRCRCDHPLGLVDEDGQVRCFKCARPLSGPATVMLPPGDFPAAA